MSDFIKIVNKDVANRIASLGFQYIKDGNCYSFLDSDELRLFLQKEFSNKSEEVVIDNKLRF